MGNDRNTKLRKLSGYAPLWLGLFCVCLLYLTSGCSESDSSIEKAPSDIGSTDVQLAEDATPNLVESTDSSKDTGQPDAGSADDGDGNDDSHDGDATQEVGSSDIQDAPWSFGPVSGEESLWLEMLSDVPCQWAASLGNNRVLYRNDGELWEFVAGAILPVAVPEGLELQDLDSAFSLEDGTGLVLGSTGLYVLQDGSLVESPLNDALAGANIDQILKMRPHDREVLWIATDGGIWRWSEGALNQLQLGDLPSISPRFTYTGEETGNDFLWVAAGQRVYAIETTDSGFQAWPELEEVEPDQLLGNSNGNLWMRTGNSLEMRDHEGFWVEADPGVQIDQIWSHPESPSLWLMDDEGNLLRWSGDQLRKTKGAPETNHISADSNDTLIMAGPTGLFRVHPGRVTAFSGISEGAVLTESTEILFEPAFPELISELSVLLNGENTAYAEDPYGLTIDLGLLVDGAYVLTVVVVYSDGFPSSENSISFSIEHPVSSWSEDVQPINQEYCAQCHGSTGYVEVKLFTKDQWIANIDLVLEYLKTQVMPPGPPLAPDLIELIELWRDLDFPD